MRRGPHAVCPVRVTKCVGGPTLSVRSELHEHGGSSNPGAAPRPPAYARLQPRALAVHPRAASGNPGVNPGQPRQGPRPGVVAVVGGRDARLAVAVRAGDLGGAGALVLVSGHVRTAAARDLRYEPGMSSSAIARSGQQNIYVTKLQAAASAPARRQAEARLHAQQAKAREARATRKLLAAKIEAAKLEAARTAAAKAEATQPEAAQPEAVKTEAAPAAPPSASPGPTASGV